MKQIHVVAAVVCDHMNQILIAKRPDHLHMGGLWEFPGGKVETGESPMDALKRELHEEVDLSFTFALPFLEVQHNYPDKSILLDVWEVREFTGTAKGNEGQEVRWVNAQDLDTFDFPSANHAVVIEVQSRFRTRV